MLYFSYSAGNVTVDNGTGMVTKAKATRLTYYVKYETETEQEFANRWFSAATEALEEYLKEEEVGARILTHAQIWYQHHFKILNFPISDIWH